MHTSSTYLTKSMVWRTSHVNLMRRTKSNSGRARREIQSHFRLTDDPPNELRGFHTHTYQPQEKIKEYVIAP